jgi:hypothetical protein
MEASEPREDHFVSNRCPLLHRTMISPPSAGRPFRFAATTLRRTTAAMMGTATSTGRWPPEVKPDAVAGHEVCWAIAR